MRRARGQALVEFGLVAILLSLILSGTIGFGFIFGHKVELDNAARAGARWAASNSLPDNGSTVCKAPCWSAATSPPVNSIEGQVRSAGGTSAISNDDRHILIQYFDTTHGAPLLCGHVSVTAGAAVYTQDTENQSTCVARGNLVSVTVTNDYPLFVNLLPISPNLSAIATFEVMN